MSWATEADDAAQENQSWLPPLDGSESSQRWSSFILQELSVALATRSQGYRRLRVLEASGLIRAWRKSIPNGYKRQEVKVWPAYTDLSRYHLRRAMEYVLNADENAGYEIASYHLRWAEAHLREWWKLEGWN